MDEATFRRILHEELDPKLADLDGRLGSLEGRFGDLEGRIDGLSADLRSTEQRLVESGQLHFRQVSQLYKGLTERIESFEKHVIEQVSVTRGAVEAVHGTIQGQAYRTDEFGRRVTALELREKE